MSKVKTPIDEMTREEYQQLRDELEHLKTVERNDISEKIRVARGFGDLSENSEYDEAKNDQARIEARISRLEERLKNVQIVEHVSTDTVAVGTKVILLDMEFDDKPSTGLQAAAPAATTTMLLRPILRWGRRSWVMRWERSSISRPPTGRPIR